MYLRPAIFKDWRFLLNCRNDPTTRLNSFDQSVVTEKQHKEWLSHSLSNDSRYILIMEDTNSESIGTIRCDTNNQNEKFLSWSIDAKHRGKGFGSLMLSLFLGSAKGYFLAEIKKENISSIKMAERNGFTYKSPQLYEKTI
tara:strand:- start:1753 stop:2175 length:423 start_codon:yes stop_codon:yes gene_type:complete